jgi:hypothetical protein
VLEIFAYMSSNNLKISSVYGLLVLTTMSLILDCKVDFVSTVMTASVFCVYGGPGAKYLLYMK